MRRNIQPLSRVTLLELAERDHWDSVFQELDASERTNKYFKTQTELLFLAIDQESPDNFRKLLSRGIDPSIRKSQDDNYESSVPIYLVRKDTLRESDLTCLEYFFAHVEGNIKAPFCRRTFCFAIDLSRLFVFIAEHPCIHHFLERILSWEVAFSHGNTGEFDRNITNNTVSYSPLHFLVRNPSDHSVAIAETLLQQGIYESIMPYRLACATSPLCLAIETEDIAMCELLGSLGDQDEDLTRRVPFETEKVNLLFKDAIFTLKQLNCLHAFCQHTDLGINFYKEFLSRQVLLSVSSGDWSSFEANFNEPAMEDNKLAKFYGTLLLEAVKQHNAEKIIFLAKLGAEYCLEDNTVSDLIDTFQEDMHTLREFIESREALSDAGRARLIGFLVNKTCSEAQALLECLNSQNIFAQCRSDFVHISWAEKPSERLLELKTLGDSVYGLTQGNVGSAQQKAAIRFQEFLASVPSGSSGDAMQSDGFIACAILRRLRFLDDTLNQTLGEADFEAVLELAGSLWQEVAGGVFSSKSDEDVEARKTECREFSEGTVHERLLAFLRDAKGGTNANSFKRALVKALCVDEKMIVETVLGAGTLLGNNSEGLFGGSERPEVREVGGIYDAVSGVKPCSANLGNADSDDGL